MFMPGISVLNSLKSAFDSASAALEPLSEHLVTFVKLMVELEE